MQKKGQAALEYLMTYGWALLLIVIVGTALYSLGVFNPSTWTGKRVSGFSSIQVSDWKYNTTCGLLVLAGNKAGSPVNITNMGFSDPTVASNNTGYPQTKCNGLPVGDTCRIETLLPGCSKTSGSAYSLTVTIYYTNLDTGITHIETGTVAGKAE